MTIHKKVKIVSTFFITLFFSLPLCSEDIVLNVFQSGDVADATKVNDNFKSLENAINLIPALVLKDASNQIIGPLLSYYTTGTDSSPSLSLSTLLFNNENIRPIRLYFSRSGDPQWGLVYYLDSLECVGEPFERLSQPLSYYKTYPGSITRLPNGQYGYSIDVSEDSLVYDSDGSCSVYNGTSQSCNPIAQSLCSSSTFNPIIIKDSLGFVGIGSEIVPPVIPQQLK